jgi:hypothetical protein
MRFVRFATRNLRGAARMRKTFAAQRRLDCDTVAQVELNFDCRSEIVPILRALQHIYSQPRLRDEILELVGQDVNPQSQRNRGRQGMDYWQVVVLAAVRLGCNLDYDALQDLAEQHRALRQIMGLGDWQGETFDWRRIRENVCKLRPQTLERINQWLVGEGHPLLPEAAEAVRADSFVAETNVHYPTEASLIRDGLRKILGLGAPLAARWGVSRLATARAPVPKGQALVPRDRPDRRPQRPGLPRTLEDAVPGVAETGGQPAGASA